MMVAPKRCENRPFILMTCWFDTGLETEEFLFYKSFRRPSVTVDDSSQSNHDWLWINVVNIHVGSAHCTHALR